MTMRDRRPDRVASVADAFRLMSLLTAVGVLAGCDKYVSVRGSVVDLEGNPVIGVRAELVLVQGGITAVDQPDAGAPFNVGRTYGFGGHVFRLTVAAAGFKAFVNEFEPQFRHRCDVRLSQLTDPRPSVADCHVERDQP
jgi:hypothetical protein